MRPATKNEPERPESNRPNVIIIVVDDQAYGDLSCMGNPKLRTPNIDRLFREGVWFSQPLRLPAVLASPRLVIDRAIQLPDRSCRYIDRAIHAEAGRGNSRGDTF